MIELGAHPVVHGVARFASDGHVQGNVIDAEGFRVDEISLMAGVALSGEALELADRGPLVAGIAIYRGVGADQGEPVQVLVDLLNGNVPPANAVALLAVGTHLALMNVGVAIGALSTDVGKHHLGMALGASHTLVHSAQRVLGGVVIKLGDGADRLPTAYCVAVLTRNAEATVGTTRIGRRLRLRPRRLTAGENRKCDD